MHLEAIVLNTLDYMDYDQIVTLYTPQLGKIKSITKGAKKRRSNSTTHPLAQVEVVLWRGKSTLFTTKELTTLDHRLALRENLELLESSCRCLRALDKSQLEEKAAPLLYELIISFLKHFPKTSYPKTLEASFLLKMLLHEGVVELDDDLLPLNATHFSQLIHLEISSELYKRVTHLFHSLTE